MLFDSHLLYLKTSFFKELPRYLKRYFTVFSMALLLSACGSENNTAGYKLDCSDYVDPNTVYSQAQSEDITIYLDTTYDVSKLIPFLDSSIDKDIKYINDVLKISTYKIPAATRLCSTTDTPQGSEINSFSNTGNFANLNAASQSDINFWNIQSSFASRKEVSCKASTKVELLGLYIYPDVPPGTTSDKPPRILLNENTDRWTDVHESMHHLINTNRACAGKAETPTNELKQLSNDAWIELVQFNEELKPFTSKTVTEDSLFELYERAHRYTNNKHLFLKRTDLEEIVIEKTLIELYLESRLKNVSPKSSIHATRYMEDKIKDVVFEVNKAIIVLNDIENLNSGFVQSSALTLKINRDIKGLEDLREELNSF